MNVERWTRPRNIQYHARCVRKGKDRASESRSRIRDRADQPISIHAKVHMDDAAILEVNELMLPATLDATNAGADESPQDTTSEAATKSWMQHLHPRQDASLDRR